MPFRELHHNKDNKRVWLSIALFLNTCYTGGYNISTVFLTLFFISSFTFSSISQDFNLGDPPIDNFTPSDYQGGTQSWRLDVSSDGLIFAANNDGLLSFDGNNWELNRLPNKTIARSISFHKDTIYIGGQDELGYFSKDDNGKLKYHSLWDIIPIEMQDIADIWDISHIDGKTFFRNSDHVYKIEGDKFVRIAKNITPNFLSSNNNKILFGANGQGVYGTDGSGPFVLLEKYKEFTDKILLDILSVEDKDYIFTHNEGVYIIDSVATYQIPDLQAQSYLIQNQITTATILRDGKIAVGTRLGGVLILSSEGQALYIIDKSKGLQSNSVTSILEDDWSNLWVGTYFGIDRIGFGFGFNWFYPDAELTGAVYDVDLWDNHWWFATENGLYSYPYQSYISPFEDITSRLVKNSEGQVWGIDVLNDQLLIAHHEAAYLLNDNYELIDLNVAEGIWKYTQLDENHIAVGTYKGVYLLEKERNNWKKLYKFSDFEESSRIMSKDNDGNLWISQPYRGVFKITFLDGFEKYEIHKYDNHSGYECEHGSYVFSISGQAVVANPCGIYTYSESDNRFELSEDFKNIFGEDQKLLRLFDTDSTLWYISESETGFINNQIGEVSDELEKNQIHHIGKAYVSGFENLFPIDTNNVIICANKGIRYYKGRKNKSQNRIKAILSKIIINNDEIISTSNDETLSVFKPEQHTIKFEFRTNGLINKDIKGYEYFLKGYDDEWTFLTGTSKEYQNLNAGEYSFQLRAISISGNKSQIKRFDFEIEAKWYKTMLAQVVGLLFAIGLLLFSLYIQGRQHKKSTAVLVEKQQETESELNVVKKEKLEDEVRFKNQELASTTLHLLQKNQTLNSLREEVDKLKKITKDPLAKKNLKKVVSILNSDDRLESDWENFSLHFDEVHVNFLSRLKEKYPQLSPRDRKLCAFLRMNLTTKEIAPILNISYRGVEISRYRLRKKLNLNSSQNLTEFVTSI